MTPVDPYAKSLKQRVMKRSLMSPRTRLSTPSLRLRTAIWGCFQNHALHTWLCSRAPIGMGFGQQYGAHGLC
jgi:hypothetical protein